MLTLFPIKLVTMTKKQKFLLTTSLALFLIPELLWSPLLNDIYARMMPLKNGSVEFFRPNFLTNIDNLNTASVVLFIEFLGLLLTLLQLIRLRKVIINKFILGLSVFVLSLLSIVSFFNFGLSIALRNIGF